MSNNPTSYVDPFGLQQQSGIGISFSDYSAAWGPGPSTQLGGWNFLAGAYDWGVSFQVDVTALQQKAALLLASAKKAAAAAPPTNSGPCPAGAAASGLIYSSDARKHIEQLHMILLPNGQGNSFTYYRRNGVDIPRSQYYFDPSGTPDKNWNLVMQINANTFSLAAPQPSRGNVTFTATLGPQNNPWPGARPYLGIEYGGSFNLFGFKVPVMKGHTSTNTLVTRSDCQTVVSSYPGNP